MRVEGYYLCPDDNNYYPSLTTVMKTVGDKYGLYQYYCKMGAKAIIWALSKVTNLIELQNRLQSVAAIEWAESEATKLASGGRNDANDFGSRLHEEVQNFFTLPEYKLMDVSDTYASMVTFTNFIKKTEA